MGLGLEARAALEAIEAGQRAADLESDRLDFKVVGRSVEDTLADLAEAAACFANAQGGQLVVGVPDTEISTEAFTDTQLDPARTQRRIYELTTPSLIVTVSDATWAGSRLVVISVPQSPDVHQVKGRATERVGTSCEPMTASRIAAVVAERRGDDWSAADSGVSTDHVSARALEAARQLLGESADVERQRWADISTLDLLRRLGLLTDAATLNRAGAMLLTENDDHDLAVYVHRRTRSGELATNQTLTGPGLIALLRCVELVDSRTDRTPINLPNGQQLLIADLPEPVFREAIVNAFMHRDYQSPGAVQVEHSPTRLSVTSPGSFVLGVTPQNILTVTSRPRNPALAATLRQLGLAETAGVGVDRMYAEMARVGHQPPTFESDDFRVSVTLKGGAPNAAVTRFVSGLPVERRSDPDTLLPLVALLTKRTVTAVELVPTLQKSADELEVVLQQLAAPPIDLIERTRESARLRAGVYRLRDHALAELGPAVAYRRRVGDDIDRKVVELVREVSQINGRVIRTLLDVDTPTASRILADLVERDVLVKTSSAQRGPAVTYGPGPQFPTKRPRKTSKARKKR